MSIVHIHVMIMLLTCFVASIDGLLVTYDVNITLNLLCSPKLLTPVCGQSRDRLELSGKFF